MKTSILATAAGLSDQDLLARLDVLAGREREASVELVAHLAALDTRPSVYAAQGYGSLFSYCTQALRLLGRHLTPDNHQAVLAKASGRSRQQSKPWWPSWRRNLTSPAPYVSSPRSRRCHSRPHPLRGPPACPSPRPQTLPRPLRSLRRPVRQSRPRRRNATACSSPSVRKPTRGFGACKRSSAARSRMVIPGRSSTGPSLCCWRGSRKPSSGRRPGHGLNRLSVLGRITQFGNRLSARAMSRARSSARPGGATPASVPSFLPPDGGARNRPSWNSTMFSPMRNRGRPRSRTSPFAVGATTSTRPS